MKSLSLVLVCAFAAATLADDESDLYERIFDDVDVDEIIDNDRILNTYLKCFFNEGHCSALAEEMKNKIPEVFSTVCGKCTPKQKDIFKHSLNKFIPKRPDDWKRLLEIYDPDGAYWPNIKAFIES